MGWVWLWPWGEEWQDHWVLRVRAMEDPGPQVPTLPSLSAFPWMRPVPLSPAATWGGPLTSAAFVSAPIKTSQLPRSSMTAVQVEGAASRSPSDLRTHVADSARSVSPLRRGRATGGPIQGSTEGGRQH